MGSTDKFCLRWNDFESNVSGSFQELRDNKHFFDVTLAVDDNPAHTLQAHKVILSACSPFFRSLLLRQGALSGISPNFVQPSPMIYLRGVSYQDMCHILDFMYLGVVNVAQEDLNSFLSVAEDLKIKGLTQNDGNNAAGGSVKREKQKREAPPDRENGAVKRPRPSSIPAQAAPVPEEQVAGPSDVVEQHLEEDAEAGPSNIKAEMAEETFEATEDYGGGEDDSYYEEGAYEGGEGMAVGGAGGDDSKGPVVIQVKGSVAQEVEDFCDRFSSVRPHVVGGTCLKCGRSENSSWKLRRHIISHIYGDHEFRQRYESCVAGYQQRLPLQTLACLICKKTFKNCHARDMLMHFMSNHSHILHIY